MLVRRRKFDGWVDVAAEVGRFELECALSHVRGCATEDDAAARQHIRGIRDLEREVHVLLGKGDGTFAAAKSYKPDNVFADEVELTSADLDGDGDFDIVTSSEDAHRINLLMNQGDGSFVHGGRYQIGLNPMRVLAPDVDADGKPEQHEKRKNTDDDGSPVEGSAKRQELAEGEKGSKKPGRKPLTNEPTTVSIHL